jgi:hypothetical protein
VSRGSNRGYQVMIGYSEMMHLVEHEPSSTMTRAFDASGAGAGGGAGFSSWHARAALGGAQEGGNALAGKPGLLLEETGFRVLLLSCMATLGRPSCEGSMGWRNIAAVLSQPRYRHDLSDEVSDEEEQDAIPALDFGGVGAAPPMRSSDSRQTLKKCFASDVVWMRWPFPGPSDPFCPGPQPTAACRVGRNARGA